MVDIENLIRKNPLADQLWESAEVLDCLRRGGNLKLEYRRVGVIPTVTPSCDLPEQNNPNAPFFRNPTDEHNPSRPTRDDTGERETEDTEEEPPQPSPKPLPNPTVPPVVIVRDFDRRVIPVPPTTNPPSIPPSIPVRRIPSLDAPEDVNAIEVAEKRLVTINQSAAERVYGCMLHSPITKSPAIYRVCRSSQAPSDDGVRESAKDFIRYLVNTIAGTVTESVVEGACITAVNLLPTKFLRYAPGGQFAYSFGCKFLGNVAANFLLESNNALQSVDGQGHINVKYVDCNPEEENTGDDGTGGLAPDLRPNDNECFVPIRNFKTNEPEQLGMKRQLQIIYTLFEEGKEYNKAITLPNPTPEITTEQIKSVFPEFFPFGEIKAEIDIRPYGLIRAYVVSEDFAQEFFDDAIALLINGEEVPDSRRFSYKNRTFKTGNFKRERAYLYDWSQTSGTVPLCKTYALD